MTEYISLVFLCDADQTLAKPYLVDRQGYYLLCSLQSSKPSKKTLKIILDWLIDNKMAILLECKPHYLIFQEGKNCAEEEN